MYKALLSRFGTAVAALLGDRVITYLIKMLDGSENLNDAGKAALDQQLSTQTLAAAIFARFGLSGVAVAYDEGIISIADFALYVVKNDSYHVAATGPDRIAELESDETRGSFFATLFPSSLDLTTVTTDPMAVSKMYTYLLAARNFRD